MKIKKIKKCFCFLILIIIVILINFFYNNNEEHKKNVKMGKTVEDSNVVQSDIVVNGKEISNFLEQSISIEPHIDENTGVKYITYEDFGAKAQEGYDDYNVIKETHEFANKNKYEVRAEEGKTYHIYRLEETEPIIVQTNTNWNNANIVIHDEDINDRDTRNYAIFQITSDLNNITINDRTILDNININKQTKKIEKLAGYGNCICFAFNTEKRQYIIGNDNGATQEDIFKIDNEGNVLNEIQWDFEKITSILLIKIPEETLTIENANFITNLPESDYEQESGYFARNIVCSRSNTIISNISHNVDNTQRLAGPYFGFIKVSYVSDIVLKDSSLYSHKYSQKSNYDLTIEHSINIAIDNVTSNDIEDEQRWRITATKYTKDITYRNCILNRIDSHRQAHNLTIENCTIGVKGLTLMGSGELNLKNVTRLGYSAFISLRSDYGSSWEGTINIENCTFRPKNAKNIISITFLYDNNELHNYGYDLYLPNINISNSDKYYIFYNTDDTVGDQIGDITKIYKLPNNVIINSYQTESGKKIKLFSNKFYNSLDELGINLSMPLSDKEEVEITNEIGEKVTDGAITNKNIRINKKETEGIKTIVKVNGNEITENEMLLNQDGNYKIETIYENSSGEREQDTINIKIDKTVPQIEGVENGAIYEEAIIPLSSSKDIKTVELYKNGQAVAYELGKKIKEAGQYELIAKDEAGNETKIEFEIQYKLEPEIEEYTLEDKYILGIKTNTKLQDFIKIFNANEKYNVYREEKQLKNTEIVATGDKLVTEHGETYYIIVQGDVTKDGITSIKDIVTIRMNILGREKFDEYQEMAADLTKDKEITVKDLVMVRKIILGQKI